MGLKSWFKNLFGRKVQVVEDPKAGTNNYLKALVDKNIYNVLNAVHDYSTAREGLIGDYSDMLNDGVTASAVELIAEDATQLDYDTNDVAWITSTEDQSFADKMNEFILDNLDFNSIAYTIAFNIIAYGEAFLDTNFANKNYTDHFEIGDYFSVASPLEVFHLYQYGVPIGYIKPEDKTDLTQILPERSYIHFISDRGNKEYLDKDMGIYIKYGTSFLESARHYYKQRLLLDDLLLLSRLTRSSHYRLFSVEVGSSTSADTARIMNEVRTAINSKQSVSVNSDVFSSRSSPIINGGNVYFPVRNGLGGVSVEEVGGEVDISALADIDYFDDRYYGALKVPKQFLGQSDEMPGGIGDTTLTKLDIRYARTVKRVQKSIANGLRSLIYWKCSIDGRLPPAFEVNLSHVLTAEDSDRIDLFKEESDRVKNVIDIVNEIDDTIIQNADKKKLIYFILQKVYKDDAMMDALSIDLVTKKSAKAKSEDSSDSSSDESSNEESSDESMNSGENTEDTGDEESSEEATEDEATEGETSNKDEEDPFAGFNF